MQTAGSFVPSQGGNQSCLSENVFLCVYAVTWSVGQIKIQTETALNSWNADMPGAPFRVAFKLHWTYRPQEEDHAGQGESTGVAQVAWRWQNGDYWEPITRWWHCLVNKIRHWCDAMLGGGIFTLHLCTLFCLFYHCCQFNLLSILRCGSHLVLSCDPNPKIERRKSDTSSRSGWSPQCERSLCGLRKQWLNTYNTEVMLVNTKLTSGCCR